MTRGQRNLPSGRGKGYFRRKRLTKLVKLASLPIPFHGPYRLLEADTNTAKIVRVDHPGDEPLLVSLCQLRRCPTEIGTGDWPPDGRKGKRKRVGGVCPSQSATTVPSSGDAQGTAQGVAGNEMLGDIEQATTTTSDGVDDCQFM